MTIIIHRETPTSPAWGEPTCDHCGATATREEIIAAGGILKMGWERREIGKHFCARCVADEKAVLHVADSAS